MDKSNESFFYQNYSTFKIAHDELKKRAQTLKKSQTKFIGLVESCKAKTTSDNGPRKLNKQNLNTIDCG